MKPLRSSIFEKAARNDAALDDVWEDIPPSGNRRSYEALGGALHDIFEASYIRDSFIVHGGIDASAAFTGEDSALFRSFKNRFTVALREDAKGEHLEIEISSANDLRVAQSYGEASVVMRDAINNFYTDLNEITAGIPGIRVDLLSHRATVAGPKPFYEMIKALCEAKDILTFEKFHELYVSYHTPVDDNPEPGYSNYLPAPQRPAYDNDLKAGTRFRRLAGNKHIIADIPHEAFASMAAQPYSLREIGSLINHYDRRSVYPFLSLQALEAVMKQDMNGGATAPDMPCFNLH